MRNVIVIYTHCKTSSHLGDFSAAGRIAQDVVKDLKKKGLSESIEVILASDHSNHGMQRFKSLYGEPNAEGKVLIEGQLIGLCSIGEIKKPDFNVVGYFESGFCYPCPNQYLELLLNPNTKACVIGTQNYASKSSEEKQMHLRFLTTHMQPALAGVFAEGRMQYFQTGMSKERDGLASYACTFNQIDQPAAYGFLYHGNASAENDAEFITQYMELQKHNKYLDINGEQNAKEVLQLVCAESSVGADIVTGAIDEEPQKDERVIVSLKPVSHEKMLAHIASATPIVAMTGVQSTLEAMAQGKVVFYQYSENNEGFVNDVIQALGCAYEENLNDEDYMAFMEATSLLFAPKPLGEYEFKILQKFLDNPERLAKLGQYNQQVLQRKFGTLVPNIMKWLTEKVSTKPQVLFQAPPSNAGAPSVSADEMPLCRPDL